MREVLDLLVNLDHEAIRATGDLHWGPATAALVLVSATISFFVASGLNALLKAAVDRSRPPQAIGVDAVIGVHASSSFPPGTP